MNLALQTVIVNPARVNLPAQPWGKFAFRLVVSVRLIMILKMTIVLVVVVLYDHTVLMVFVL
jgi:hypothetical protein